jgi:hypothetical protein
VIFSLHRFELYAINRWQKTLGKQGTLLEILFHLSTSEEVHGFIKSGEGPAWLTPPGSDADRETATFPSCLLLPSMRYDMRVETG